MEKIRTRNADFSSTGGGRVMLFPIGLVLRPSEISITVGVRLRVFCKILVLPHFRVRADPLAAAFFLRRFAVSFWVGVTLRFE